MYQKCQNCIVFVFKCKKMLNKYDNEFGLLCEIVYKPLHNLRLMCVSANRKTETTHWPPLKKCKYDKSITSYLT